MQMSGGQLRLGRREFRAACRTEIDKKIRSAHRQLSQIAAEATWHAEIIEPI
jgi:hypothetical protein